MRRSSINIGAVVAGMALVAMPSAAAGPWYSASAPLVAYEDGVAQAQAYGNMFIENNTFSRNNSYQKDPRSGGDPVYVRTQWKYKSDAVGVWINDTLKTTVRSSVNSWVYDWDHDELRDLFNDVRMQTRVCEDQTLSGDPCSSEPLQTFSY